MCFYLLPIIAAAVVMMHLLSRRCREVTLKELRLQPCLMMKFKRNSAALSAPPGEHITHHQAHQLGQNITPLHAALTMMPTCQRRFLIVTLLRGPIGMQSISNKIQRLNSRGVVDVCRRLTLYCASLTCNYGGRRGLNNLGHQLHS